MPQVTSLQAYASIIPTLGHKQAEVLQALITLGPSTHKELARYLKMEINTITPRVGELVRMGYVTDLGKKEQEGRKAMVWGVKDSQMPIFF